MQLVTGVTEALQLAPQVTDVHVQAAIMLGMTAVQDMLVFAVDASLGRKALAPAAEERIHELGWRSREGKHLCPKCQ